MLRQYADDFSNGPGAVYVGDLTQLAGPASGYRRGYNLGDDSLGDDSGNVSLSAIRQHQWLYESDYYRLLLEKANLTNPTPLTSRGEEIEIQHVCLQRNLLPCVLMETYFAPTLLERTNGQVRITITSFPELGLFGPDTLGLIYEGTLDMAEVFSGYIREEIPFAEAQNLWGLWPDHQTSYLAQTSIIGELDEMIESQSAGVILNRNWYFGDDQFIFCRENIDTPEGLEGKIVRSHGATLSDSLNGMGAEAQFMPFGEVYTALDRGILDCGVAGAHSAYQQRWYEVAGYMIGPLHSFDFNANLINLRLWNTIPDDLRQILIEEGAKHELEALRLASAQNLTGVQRNIDAGMELVEFAPETRLRSFLAARDSVIPGWLRQLGYPRKPGDWEDAVAIFNSKISPLVGVRMEIIEPRNWVWEEVQITEGPNAGRFIKEVLLLE